MLAKLQSAVAEKRFEDCLGLSLKSTWTREDIEDAKRTILLSDSFKQQTKEDRDRARVALLQAEEALVDEIAQAHAKGRRHCFIGARYEEAGDLPNAEKYAASAVELAPKERIFRVLYHNTLAKQQKFSAAIVQLQAAADLGDPSAIEALAQQRRQAEAKARELAELREEFVHTPELLEELLNGNHGYKAQQAARQLLMRYPDPISSSRLRRKTAFAPVKPVSRQKSYAWPLRVAITVVVVILVIWSSQWLPLLLQTLK